MKYKNDKNTYRANIKLYFETAKTKGNGLLNIYVFISLYVQAPEHSIMEKG